jgi:hypothetical protein
VNLHDLTPALLRTVAHRLIIPAVVLLIVGGIIVYATVRIAADNRRLLADIGPMLWQVDKIDARITGLAKDLNVIRTQGRHYDEIRESGFVGEQSRLRAAQLLEELGPKYGLTTLRYDFMPQVTELATGEEGTEFRLIRTDISLDIEAMTDTQLLGFVAEFSERLSGQVQVRFLEVERALDVTSEVLEQIAAGERPALFQAQVRLTWNNVTVVVDESTIGDDHGALDKVSDDDTDRS